MTATNPKPTPATFHPARFPGVDIIPHRNPTFGERPESFGADALRRAPDLATYRTSPSTTWAAARDEWAARITAEELMDLATAYYRSTDRWNLRPSDGAFMRGDRGVPLAIQPRAFGQMLSLLLQEVPDKPRGPAPAFGWLSPEVRWLAFADVVSRSRRGEGAVKTQLLLRTHLTTLRDHAGAVVRDSTGEPVRYRALRAVLSGRHAGVHFDDSALLAVLDERVRHDAPAYVSRGTDETHGMVTLDAEGDARATLAFRNSETGAASLSFGAGCYLSVLDAVVRRPGAERVADADLGDDVEVARELREQERRAMVAVASGQHRRRHSLPSGTEAQRAEVARGRIAASFDVASTEARGLVVKWREALSAFPAGHRVGEPQPGDRLVAAEVALDAIESASRIRVNAEDRKALGKIIEDEERLRALPWLSAAYVAGAFAVLARDTGDAEEARRLQMLAGEWLDGGWK